MKDDNTIIKEQIEWNNEAAELCLNAAKAIKAVLHKLYQGKTYYDIVYGVDSQNPEFSDYREILLTLRVQAESFALNNDDLEVCSVVTTYVTDPEADEMVRVTGTFPNSTIEKLGPEKTNKLSVLISENIGKVAFEKKIADMGDYSDRTLGIPLPK